MDVKFSEYRFLRDQLILYKHDKIIPLKRNQALLLDFFIANPDGIHSKDAIMDAVWQDKVVSEQVVFQTISQLRSIVGPNAIKTFSKKGYKWEIDCYLEPTITREPTGLTLAKVAPQVSKRTHWIVFFFVTLIVGGIFFLQALETNEQVTLHLVQSIESTTTKQKTLIDLTKHTITQDGVFTVNITQKNNSSRQLFSAPKLAWQQSKIPEQEWLLWTETFSSSKGIFLNYGISRDSADWHGYVYAETNEQLAQKLSNRLMQLYKLGLFSKSNSKLDIHSLTSMNQVDPNDPDLLLRLAKHYSDVKQLDIAMTYAQKLTNLDPSYGFSPYRANAQRLMADIYKKRGKYQLATNSLNNMSTILTDTPLWPLVFENISDKAWLAYKQHDFEKMFEILEQGVKFVQKQDDALTLFELHILYSILAKKGGDDHKKYSHLNEAQALLLKHKLHESNFVIVYFHFAIFTQDNNKALPYLEKIIGLPKTKRNGRFIDHATEMLIDQYIEQQDYALALSLSGKQPDSPKHMLSLAKVYHAQDQQEKARSYFVKSFELARLQYKIHIAIESSLMLYQLSAQQPEIQAEYLDYLQRNANEEWLKEQMNIIADK